MLHGYMYVSINNNRTWDHIRGGFMPVSPVILFFFQTCLFDACPFSAVSTLCYSSLALSLSLALLRSLALSPTLSLSLPLSPSLSLSLTLPDSLSHSFFSLSLTFLTFPFIFFRYDFDLSGWKS